MSVINTNITSLIAQQNLNKSQNDLTTAMERLSSGMRINSARDDAAGQAIANRFSSQINGLNQAVRNSNDGISIAQTTEGSLNQINDNLQTIRTLTVQAQNGTNSESDLGSIQDEIQQRLDEIDRISQETDFNGTKVLAESAASLRVQVGANDGQTIDIGLRQIDVSSLGLTGFNVDGTSAPNSLASETQILAQGFTENTDGSFTNTQFNSVATIADGFGQIEDGGTVYDGNAAAITYTFDAAAGNFTFDQDDRVDANGTALSASLTPSGTETSTLTITGTSTEPMDVTVDSTGNIRRASDGVQLYFDQTSGNLTQENVGGHTAANIDDVANFLENSASGTASISITAGDTVYASNATSVGYDVTNDVISSVELQEVVSNGTTATFDIDVDGTGQTTYDFLASGTLSSGATGLFVSGFDSTRIESQATANVYVNDDGAFTDGVANLIYAEEDGSLTYAATGESTVTEDPLATLDTALANIDSLRSELGAVQNRFSDAIVNLETNALNLSDARSRIEDADYAKEVANMTRAQILQQAGTSVLAQANQLPQNVLSLLG